MEKECVVFNGHTYCRYPSSPHKHLQFYFWPSRTDRKKYGLEVLHREIWKATYGPIPEGYHVHHRDDNKLNNDPTNFECLTPEEHGQRHPRGHPDWLLEHLDNIRGQATEWHRSAEGREWHKQHGKATWEKRQPVTKVCVFCHQEYETLVTRTTARYCSDVCERKWNAAHKKYHVEGKCEVCGVTFSAIKFRPQRTCGRKCAAQLRIREGTHSGMKRE